MARPRISLCMIVRNEAELLGECLAAAAPLVDETIVVDTGSTDQSIAVAEAAGATVLRQIWNDDFSAARNVALDAASGDWILVLDADERLESCEFEDLRRRLAAFAPPEAWSVTICDELDDGGTRRYELVRLFRNRDAHRYRGTIHEQITPAIARTLGTRLVEPERSGLVVRHLGYRAEHVERQGKVERNRSMLRRAVERDPADASLRYFLIRELVPLRAGRAVPGAHLAEALEHCGWLAAGLDALPARFRSAFVAYYGAALIAESRSEEARGLVATLGDDTPAIELLRADIALALDGTELTRIHETLDRLQSAFDRRLDPDDVRTLVDEPALSGALARERAARLCLALGQFDAARHLAREAMNIPGGGSAACRAMAAAERAAGDDHAALAAYGEALRRDPYDPWAWCELGETLLELGQRAEGLNSLDNAARLAPGWSRPCEARELDAATLADSVATSASTAGVAANTRR